MRTPIVSISQENRGSRLALMTSFCFFIKEGFYHHLLERFIFQIPAMVFSQLDPVVFTRSNPKFIGNVLYLV